MNDIYSVKYDIDYNGSSGEDHDVFLYDYAIFSGAEKKYQTFSVGGRLGELVGEDEYKSNLTIQCTFAVLSVQFMADITAIKRWLKGTGKLTISDHPDIFYKIWKVNYGDIERELRNFGQFTVSFTCTPFQFLKSGQTAVSSIDSNPYDKSMPIYTITGNGAFTLTVNGNQMTGTVNGTITIDTERMISYNAEGVSQNNVVSGDYEELYIPSGDVSISISGGTLSIVPQWGYDV